MNETQHPLSLARNLTSLLGILMTAFGFVAGIALILLDMQSEFSSPYVGIFTYLVMPVIIVTGLLLILVGVLRERRRRRRGEAGLSRLPVINLNDHRHFTAFAMVLTVTFLFIALSGVGSYRAYHFTESVTFCGITCHSVMKPEHTAYQHSPHANTKCTTCHIGPGADFFVKAKLNGLYQVYSTMFNKYNRPIPAPVHNLRPAKETCYTCHWPEKFFGAVELNRTYFRADEENSPWNLRMLIKVGGGDAKHGRAQGIHWHMARGNEMEYIATDEKRLEIPWIRMRDENGREIIYETTNKKKRLSPEQIAAAEIRVMDCIDCHNRPTHQFHSPERALNEAMAMGQIDPSIPFIKMHAIEVLTAEYATEPEALAAIEAGLREKYPDGGPVVEQAIAGVKDIFSSNIFPEMKVSWMEYPDHIGHMITPGCFRCHDGEHVAQNGDVVSKDCDACHTILAQGPGLEPENMNVAGLPFEHPEDIGDEWMTTRCDECHTGVPVL